MRKTPITPETMLKVWKLHKIAVETNIIAETLGISSNSVNRVIRIMTTAQNGGDVDSIEGHQRQKDFAKRMFGIKTAEEKLIEKREEQKELECKTVVDECSKDFMQKVLQMLAWQNELLELLCNELGADWKTHCKGVERR